MIKIFALPGAGSSAITYYKWMKYLPKSFVIIPLDLPGRGMKMKENKIFENNKLIRYFYLEICKKISDNEDDYILIGNSFSSILAIQLCREIEQEKMIRKPKHLFLAVEPSPDTLLGRKKMSEDINRIDFVKNVLNKFFSDNIISSEKKDIILSWILKKLYYDKKVFLKLNVNDIYKNLFKSNESIDQDILELIDFTIEHLKLFLEDEKIIENLDKKKFLVSTDITVFGASDDSVASEDDLKKWEKFTTGCFRLEMFKGDHTILYDNPELVILKMKEVLENNYE